MTFQWNESILTKQQIRLWKPVDSPSDFILHLRTLKCYVKNQDCITTLFNGKNTPV